MAKWRLAKSLERLRTQVNEAYPNRSKVSDGTIGDARHQASASSDHNPHIRDPATGIGVVTAIDLTNDPASGVDGLTLSIQLTKDPRAKYVIFNARIWKARTGTWEWYTGPNAHRHHVHLSVKPESMDDVSEWSLGALGSAAAEAIKEESRPTLKRGDRGPMVELLQVRLGIEPDKIFGPRTEAAVRAFQDRHGLEIDGRVGPLTRRALGL
jgi:peptidoglycan hydrolase-like protein with peptidoglycan-binding domain